MYIVGYQKSVAHYQTSVMASRHRRMENDINFDALDAYNRAWVSGDAEEIYPVLADSYTLRLGDDCGIVGG